MTTYKLNYILLCFNVYNNKVNCYATETRQSGGIALPFFTLAPVADEWSISHPDPLYPRETTPGSHFVGFWMGPIASLDVVEKRKVLISAVN
jgi:hypothetical protein